MEDKGEKKTEEHSGHHSKRKKEHSNKTLTSKMRKNPWMVSTFVLSVLVVIMLIFGSFGTSKSISSDKAGQSLLEFANAQGANAELVGVNDSSSGDFYEVTLLIQGQNIPIYVTKDGEFFTSSLIPLTTEITPTQQTPPPTDVPKSDKPVVELFVMSYCPYGTQAEKGILPVVSLLGDKIDFKLRMVHYTLHGEKEDLENNRQLCIREGQSQNVLNKYLVCILNSTNPNAPADVAACEKESGVNSAMLKTCLTTKAEDYFAADSELSEGYGVQGSPTLIINGVQSNAGRSPASYLAGICNAFNVAPDECNEALSTASPSAGFGYNEGTDTVAQC